MSVRTYRPAIITLEDTACAILKYEVASLRLSGYQGSVEMTPKELIEELKRFIEEIEKA